ncbi:hypothetical protein ITP53_54350 [Nonomuraea sp. K274]|uniref:Thiopeptide-type bacteriocin biosynthesis domain-containing protein n=1 Tax=Nonomuraea cypriaca TaxID=1187855 RepID=A0A931F595_9ACTN|nr:lantibiotic dehydratase C-terminal domain-containing protein [Nonomuraea cypriaca]MBF8194495.1 hypothetical protein [Nonomuraea cypriaca]
MSDQRWLSAHLHYRGDLDTLLRDAVAPLVRALGADFFFLRYWDGGSHVRLRLRGADEAVVVGHMNAYFAAHPAPESMTAREYAEVAAVLAAREGMTDHLTSLRPNNSVEFAPYRPETAKYGTGDTLRAVERHFTESSRLALDVLDRRPTANQRELAVLGILLLSWYAAGVPGVRPADDVEALCRGWRGGQDLPEDRVEAEFAPVRERVLRLANALRPLASTSPDSGPSHPGPSHPGLGSSHPGPGPSRPGPSSGPALGTGFASGAGPASGTSLHAWAGTFARLSAALAAVDRPGDGPVDQQADPPVGRPADGPVGRPADGAVDRLVVVDNCAHLAANRLGVSMAAEVRLRLLAVRGLRESVVAGRR